MLSARPSPVRLALLAAAAATFLPGCNRDGRQGKLVLPADGGVQEPGVDPALRIVLAATSLRREPSEQARVKLEGAKGTAANFVALLPRGERVILLEGRDGWSLVRAPGGAEGWLRTASVAPASETQEATVLEVASAFDGPDLLAVNARRRLEPGALLFIRKSKDLFTEVDAGPGQSAWILTDRLSTQPADVAASRLVEKGRLLWKAERPAEAREVLALLRSTLPGSPLVPVLAADLGEAPPDGAGAPSAPEAGLPAPSGPGGAP